MMFFDVPAEDMTMIRLGRSKDSPISAVCQTASLPPKENFCFDKNVDISKASRMWGGGKMIFSVFADFTVSLSYLHSAF